MSYGKLMERACFASDSRHRIGCRVDIYTCMIVVCPHCHTHIPRNTIEEMFWSQVDKSGDCWNWLGFTNYGYGSFTFKLGKKKTRKIASRFAWEMLVGQIPKGMHVCHKCDNRRCVRPEHLFLGSPNDNVQDMVYKKRNVVGEDAPSAKLTEENVREIRLAHSNGIGCTTLSRRYGVSEPTILKAVKRRTWKHVA